MSKRIVIDPEVCGGRPIVAGTRMRVVDVLDALANGAGIDELLADFPYLTREDIQACLAYAAHFGDTILIRVVIADRPHPSAATRLLPSPEGEGLAETQPRRTLV